MWLLVKNKRNKQTSSQYCNAHMREENNLPKYQRSLHTPTACRSHLYYENTHILTCKDQLITNLATHKKNASLQTEWTPLIRELFPQHFHRKVGPSVINVSGSLCSFITNLLAYNCSLSRGLIPVWLRVRVHFCSVCQYVRHTILWSKYT